MVLTETRVKRGLVLLEADAHGVLVTVTVDPRAWVGIARCLRCGRRPRVLPCDALPKKTYAATVIEHQAAEYSPGDRSLRQVAWGQLGERTPSHTTLHGWTEGLGAHVLGRPGGDAGGIPASRFLADAAARVAGVAAAMHEQVHVNPRRYRSEARRERLAAMAQILAVVTLVATQRHPFAMAECRRLACLWSTSSALAFRSRLRCTSIEHVGRPSPARSGSSVARSRDRCPTRTRSPPGASSRSPP